MAKKHPKKQKNDHVKQVSQPAIVVKRPFGEALLGWIGVIVLLAALAMNIGMSQMIHPLYQGVVDGNQKALVTFFKIAKTLPAFEPLKADMNNSYVALAKEIDGENITRQEKIKKIEGLLVLYPKSRDLLLAASVLYHDIGNPIKSDEYLKQAQEIDPTIQ